jgi:hypothetical protein
MATLKQQGLVSAVSTELFRTQVQIDFEKSENGHGFDKTANPLS